MILTALKDAGFLGLEEEAEVIHARLPDGITPFRVMAEGEEWTLSLTWPLRASATQIESWNARHQAAPMDLWQGETRVSYRSKAAAEDLHHWTALAEEAMAEMIRWRRAQRAPGEGM